MGVQTEQGDSSDASRNFRSTQRRFTWWVRQCEGETSRTVTHLSVNTFPVVTEELVSGIKSPFMLLKNNLTTFGLESHVGK